MLLHGAGFCRFMMFYRALLQGRVRPGVIVMLMVLVSRLFVEVLPLLGAEVLQFSGGGRRHVHAARPKFRHHILSRRAVRIGTSAMVLTRLATLLETATAAAAATTPTATRPAGFALVFATLWLLHRTLALALILGHGLLLFANDVFHRR